MTEQTLQYEKRRETLRGHMHAAGLSALLVSMDANRYYLSGFELSDSQPNESSGCLIIMADGNDILCTDPRFFDAAKAVWDEKHIFIYHGSAAEQLNRQLAEKVRGTIGFEAEHISCALYKRLAPGLTLQPADGLVEQMRIIKDFNEIEHIKASCDLNHQLMNWVEGVLTPGRTEKQIAWDIEQFFRNNGAEGLSFSTIVGIDENAALPHAIPTRKAITNNCSVLIDTGCRLNDYCSDQTRTFWVGNKPSDTFLFRLEHVQKAQEKAIQMIKPGVACADIYFAAKRYLDSKGLGDYFTHGLGHGIGLQTHEAPSLNSRNTLLLQPGMVVTVEPGVYFSGDGGIRWEHMVLVTEDGAQVL